MIICWGRFACDTFTKNVMAKMFSVTMTDVIFKNCDKTMTMARNEEDVTVSDNFNG